MEYMSTHHGVNGIKLIGILLYRIEPSSQHQENTLREKAESRTQYISSQGYKILGPDFLVVINRVLDTLALAQQ